MIKLIDLLKEAYGGGEYEVPSDHLAAMKVPNGGACCTNCEYWAKGKNGEEGKCLNKMYEKWAGTASIPEDPNEYCSDWWEPKG